MKVGSMIELVTDQSWSNFQLGVEYNWDFIAFCFFLLCYWFKILVLQSQPIRSSSKNSGDLVTCVFPRSWRLLFFILRSYWLSEIFPSL